MSQSLEILSKWHSALCETNESLRQAYLPEHSISRDRSLLGRIEEDVSLFFEIFIIVVDGSSRSKSRIVYGKVEKVWRDTIHVTVIVQLKSCWSKRSKVISRDVNFNVLNEARAK